MTGVITEMSQKKRFFDYQNKSLRNQVGMTLLEIMIVLAIIGSLIAMLVPGVMEKLNNARMKETKIAIAQILQAIGNYQIDCGKLPSSLESLSRADADCPNWGPEPYMRKVPKDAWGKEFSYDGSSGNPVIRTEYKGKEISSEESN